jgi:glutaredoxin
MRATLVGAVVCVLLVLLGRAVLDRGTGEGEGGVVSGWLARRAPPPAPAPESPEPGASALPVPRAGAPAAPAAATGAAKPAVLAAGEVSVVDAEPREPMVRYADADGSIHMVRGLAQVPVRYRPAAVVLDRGSVNVVSIPAPTAVAFRDWQPDPNPNRSDVVLFGAPWCAACARAKRHLDQRGIPYDERDIDADDAARQEVERILGRIAIPLLEVGGRYISGFRPDVYDRALGSL